MSEEEFPTGFEWDIDKAEANYRKHGVTFEECCEIFSGHTVDWYDLDHSKFEDRWNIVGLGRGKFLRVTYTFRGSNKRLITAWPATRMEIELWFASQTLER